MKEVISDTSKFEQINIEEDKQLNFILKSEEKDIDFTKRLENNCSNFHPILPAIGTPTCKLVNFLITTLSSLTVVKFLVHDSFSFADKDSSFCPDHFMASLDVERLFTIFL